MGASLAHRNTTFEQPHHLFTHRVVTFAAMLMNSSSHRLATFAVLLAAALFGTTGTVLVNAPASADAYSVGAVRLLIGGATLSVVAWRVSSAPLAAWRLPSTVIGAVGVAVFQLGYFLAVERTGVAVGTVITIGSGPVLGGVLHAVLHRSAPRSQWLLGTTISIIGVGLLGLLGSDIDADPLGMGLAVLAGLGWAVFASVGKRQISQGIDSTGSMAAMFTGGALLLSPLLLVHSPAWVGQGSGLLVALYLGVVTVGVAYTLYGIALRALPATSVITLTLLEPITAALLGVVVVNERIAPVGWAGIALVLVGLVLTATVTE